MKKTRFFIVIMLAVMLMACGNDKKDKAPELTISFPVNTTSYARAGEFTFSGTATDDVELKTIRFALSFKSGLKGVEDPWQPEEDVRMLTGKEKSFDKEKVFNTDILYECKAGVYTLLVEVTDKGGNTTSKTIDVTID